MLKNKNDSSDNSHAFEYQEKLTKNMTDTLLNTIKHYNESVTNSLLQISSMSKDNIKDIIENQDKLLKSNSEQLEKATLTLATGLEKMQKDNEHKLEQMRLTVDEKLNVSLQTRLNESFKIINERLQSVYEGLGEMKSLATGVGDLKKVLTNVKTRGTWGEVQLNSLLEQMLAPNQYMANVEIKKNSGERADFVVVIPSKNDTTTYLPIDAKFPIEDYQRLIDALETGVKAEIELQSKNLERRIKEEAKKIKEKYIDVPNTTDFAIMYLPIEGLYAEVLRNNSLSENLQRTHKIIICGPTTLSAMLNSLQLGFRTITIEKRSTEIWSLLGTFKQEFGRFVELLSKTQKKLDEASKTIEDATKKSRTIEKKLKGVDSLDIEELKELDVEEEINEED